MPRPDGQWLLRLPEDSTRWSGLVATLPDRIGPTLLSVEEGRADALLRSLGFRANRTDQLWEVALRDLPRSVTSADHELVRITGCDLTAVTDLDNAVRAQIPGTEGWVNSVPGLQESLEDDEFDPELYLIAVHRHTGSYDGLIRVWNRPVPRLGCVGVRAEWRRTRVGPALIAAAADVLQHRGVTHVVAETDITNRDSHPLAARNGAMPRGRTVEWILRDHPGHAGVANRD